MADRVDFDGSEGTWSVGRVTSVLIERRRWIAALALTCAAATTLALAARGRTFTSTAAFTADAGRQANALAGLAAQIGVPTFGAGPGNSPQFYADLTRSRVVLGAVADSSVCDADGGCVGLAGRLRIRGDDTALVRDKTIAALGRRVDARVNPRTGVVRVRVRMPTRALALEVNGRLLALLNEFNLRTRRSQASAEREFTARRLIESKEELRVAEDRLQTFLQRNRDYRGSPQLVFASDRLQREIDLRQAIVSTLAEAYERARIEEVRDTPAITVIEQAEVPARPDSRRLVPFVVFALIAGALLSSVGALAWHALGSVAPSGHDKGLRYAE